MKQEEKTLRWLETQRDKIDQDIYIMMKNQD